MGHRAPISERDRVAVFIDYGYLRCVQGRLHVRLNIVNFARRLVHPATCVHVYVYDCLREDNERFINALSHQSGITVRLGQLTTHGETQWQKGVDVLLALDVWRLAHQPRDRVSTAVLVTGDGDFVPLVREAQDCGMRVFIAHADSTVAGVSRNLLHTASGSILITKQLAMQCEHGRVVEEAAAETPKIPPLVLPVASRTVSAADGQIKLKAGEVARIKSGGRASVAGGAIAIAEPRSSVHALKGAAIYLFPDVALTGTNGFSLIPVSGRPVVNPAEKPPAPQRHAGQATSGNGKRKRLTEEEDAQELKVKFGLLQTEAATLARMRRGFKLGLAARVTSFLENPRAFTAEQVEAMIASCGNDFAPIKSLLQDSLRTCAPESLQ